MQLHTKTKLLSLHGKIEIYDENDNVAYEVHSKAISIHNTTYIKRANGEDVAVITKKPFSIHAIHDIEMSNGEKFEIKSDLRHPIKDLMNIKALGWHMQGDLLKHNYTIYDEDDNVIARTHMKWLSIHQMYFIDIEDDSQADKVVALYITLEHIMQDSEATAEDATDLINEFNPGANNN